MINLQSETVISFAEAAKRLPRRRGGKRPHVATLYRWSQRGCRGRVLDSIQVGGTRCTSVEALQRFCDALSLTPATQPVRATAALAARQAEVDRLLDALGL